MTSQAIKEGARWATLWPRRAHRSAGFHSERSIGTAIYMEMDRLSAMPARVPVPSVPAPVMPMAVPAPPAEHDGRRTDDDGRTVDRFGIAVSIPTVTRANGGDTTTAGRRDTSEQHAEAQQPPRAEKSLEHWQFPLTSSDVYGGSWILGR